MMPEYPQQRSKLIASIDRMSTLVARVTSSGRDRNATGAVKARTGRAKDRMVLPILIATLQEREQAKP